MLCVKQQYQCIYISRRQKTNVMDAIILYYVWMYVYRENYESKDMYVEEDESVQILVVVVEVGRIVVVVAEAVTNDC